MTGTSEAIYNAFLRDVDNHVMHIEHEDGVYRRISYRNPKSCSFSFELNTWPDHLCICGDMGCYVFSRVTDMFKFFRGDRINAPYWSEKLLSADTQCHFREYSPQVYREAVRDYPERDSFDSDEDYALFMEEIAEIENQETEHEARAAAESFKSSCGKTLDDFWEIDLTQYTTHYLWCLHAIVWGIQKFDESKTQSLQESLQ